MDWIQLRAITKDLGTQYAAEYTGKISGKLPIDVFGICLSLGVKVFLSPMQEQGVLHFVDNQPAIYIRDNSSITLRRWAAAHALGHLLLHTGNLSGGIYFRDKNYNVQNDIEQSANTFAANLLIPELELRYFISQGLLSKDLAQRFNVSISQLNYQLSYLA